MFKEARIKLTAWYLAIIMAISLSFSVAIYVGVNGELTRVDNMQRSRQQRVDTIDSILISQGLPVPPENQPADSETVEQARMRIIWALGLINVSILVLSSLGGYFLAEQTLDPIKKMMDEQKEFVGNASHELRTPLTSLKTEIEVALRDRRLSILGAKSLLKSNLEDVDKMQKLSNYLLELNKFENGKGVLEMKEIDLREVVKKAVDGKKVAVNLHKSIVKGNEDSLIELTTILLENAFKYSPKKTVVEVRTKEGGMLEVEDHGMGIPAEDLPHIFDRFYRSDKSRGTDGYGLGLSIAKSIVDAHGGKISVKSKIGKGTTFTVML
ncbi:MAG: ATP-binding protein [Candidatus Microgenomates bacterium]|jgi:signal transduction histidine kinase